MVGDNVYGHAFLAGSGSSSRARCYRALADGSTQENSRTLRDKPAFLAIQAPSKGLCGEAHSIGNGRQGKHRSPFCDGIYFSVLAKTYGSITRREGFDREKRPSQT